MNTTKLIYVRSIVLFLLILIACSYVAGQVNQYNMQLIDLANSAYEDVEFAQAIDLYNRCPIDSLSNVELKRLADCYWQVRNYNKSLEIYQKISEGSKDLLNDIEQFRVGSIYSRIGNNEEANKWLEGIEGYKEQQKTYTDKVRGVLIDSVLWQVRELNLNTPYREFAPTIYNGLLFFSSNRPIKEKQQTIGWDGEFYSRLWQEPISNLKFGRIAKIDTGKITTKSIQIARKKIAKFFDDGDVKPSLGKINKYYSVKYNRSMDSLPGNIVPGFEKIRFNTGGVAFDDDNTIYFTANYPNTNANGENLLCLMQGKYIDNAVIEMKQMPFGDDSYSVMHPAVTANGKMIVFSSNKSGGVGQFDLYYSLRDSTTHKWMKPVLIQGNVNTIGNEVFPSITSDGYLYYSSDGKQGMGGLDIYRIKLNDIFTGKGVPEHMPYPVNSKSDDFGWTQTVDGAQAFITSDRTYGEDNLYAVNYDADAARKLALARIKRTYLGYVYDRQTKDPIRNAIVFLLDKSDRKVYVAVTNANGKYTFSVQKEINAEIVAVAKDYSTDGYSVKIVCDLMSSVHAQNAPRDLLLDRFVSGYKWQLANLHYDLGKWNIRSDARPILDSLASILKKYPITVEFGSHTDSRGSYEYNDRLSQKRAESAVAYIISQGVEKTRIKAKGYGKRQLLNKCNGGVPCSEEEHAQNRRTEVKVISDNKTNVLLNIDWSRFKPRQVLSIEQLPEGVFPDFK